MLPTDSTTLGEPDAAAGAPASPPKCAPSDLPPDFIPGYTLLSELHRGGQGVVYLAHQKSTKRRVAIKLQKEGPFAGTADRARFEREVEILGQLRHPNIVTIHDSGQVGGCFYFVMDYISGQSLDAWILGGSTAGLPSRSVAQTLELFSKICQAVNAAHLRGIVHRDLKPRNILVDAEGEPHILDFGLAKVALSSLTSDPEALPITVTGHFMGSLPWAAPEQAEAQPARIDTRTDVYSLGVLLYQMLTGRFPYEVVGNMRDVLDHILNTTPTRPSTVRRQIDDEVETIVLTCLQKERERRYQTAGDLGRDIARYLSGEPIDARRDSVLYLLKSRTTKLVRRHPWPCVLLCGALAVGLAQGWPGKPLIYAWANRPFEKVVQRGFAGRAPRLDTVRVVALTPQTDLAAAAERAGLTVEQLRSDRRALRAVHGRLLERLAAAGPAVVGFDISFDGDSPDYDDAFVRGVEALRTAHSQPCPVVAAVNRWSFAPASGPPLSNRIYAVAQWGCSPANLQPDQPWDIYLALGREGLPELLPGLETRMLAAYQRPSDDCSLFFDAAHEEVVLHFSQHAAGPAGARVPHGTPAVLRATGVRVTNETAVEAGIQPNDAIARYRVLIPSDEILAGATMDYGQILAADDAQLRQQFAGKIVLICNQRDGPPPLRTPEGRSVAGTYAHAAALEMLLRDTGVQLAAPAPALGATCAAALLGMALGWSWYRRPAPRWLVLALASAGLIGLGLVAALQLATLYNPLIAVLALLIAGETSAAVHRLHRQV